MTPRHVVVVGAGPAGLAAAEAALSAGARVTLIDAADQVGGQYHRMSPDAYAAARPEQPRRGRRAFADRRTLEQRAFDRRRRRVLAHPRCTWWPDTAVWALERRDGDQLDRSQLDRSRPDRSRPDRDQPDPGQSHPDRLHPERPGPPRVHVLRGPADGGRRPRFTLDPDALVLAVGAHDRVLPFPGWELPGVFTAGAAQALAKGERVVVGDRVVIAGTGPFLLPVAASLLEAGSRVLAVLEANTPATVARGWAGRPWQLAAQAGKASELATYASMLARQRVPYRTARAVIEARGDGRVEEVVTARLRADWSVVPGSERAIAVDAVCVTHGFSPQLELPLAAGCALRTTSGGEFVDVDDDQLTSVPGVYAAGEITGVAGAPAARAEGALAGWLAGHGVLDLSVPPARGAQDPSVPPAQGAPDPSVSPAHGTPGAPVLRHLRRSRDQGRAFAERLARAHPIGAAWPGWLRPETVICRCEEADYAALCRAAGDRASAAARVAKLETRAGLGPCQARICGPTVAELSARLSGEPAERPVEGLPTATPHRRPIAQPIRLGELAAAPASPAQDPPNPLPRTPPLATPGIPTTHSVRPPDKWSNSSTKEQSS
ncbi:FAD-dependent oxidoreductase [Streptomyces pathocidini]|uniref:FAD-dependent oxidoreductase n=1 Tax=Streptomyces pathocidini TaxID=1650571 RepID=A0ABW7UKB6_9ACTN